MANGEDIIRDIIGTFSMVIVELGKSLEKQQTGFMRRQFATTLRDAVRTVPADSENLPMIKDILENIAADIAGDETKPRRIKFSRGKS